MMNPCRSKVVPARSMNPFSPSEEKTELGPLSFQLLRTLCQQLIPCDYKVSPGRDVFSFYIYSENRTDVHFFFRNS